MQVSLFQSGAGRFSVVFAASCYVSIKLVAEAIAHSINLAYTTEIKPVALEVHRFYTSPTAKALYRFTGRAILAAIALAAYTAFMAGGKFRAWSDGYVDSCLEKEATPAVTVSVKPVVVKAGAVEAIAPVVSTPLPVRTVKGKKGRSPKLVPVML
ncbi:hypothetical protein H6F86_20540 [Phormidium sp. FACHB-592]|uniref:Uncharacterized protein n=1 Tax=Stenomitos frigidus AS-A4 TaxID=2933935 RepID=A0ABV0KEE8_9CYAN|nr:hypothetical protein [Phormidium sp. FACHB-592]MBD2076221.1 hypothetical protein [Phormidium sp. FACHB-592]